MEKKTIKCPVCSETAELKEKETELLNGLAVLKKDRYYEWRKCREKFSTPRQVKTGLEQLKEAFSFKRQVIKTGRSLAITLPNDLIEFYKLKKGGTIKLIPESSKKITIILSQ